MIPGIRFVVDVNIVEIKRQQVRFPRSRKRRIRKKWASKNCNWIVERIPACYQMGNVLYVHPRLYESVKAYFKTEYKKGFQ